MTTNQVSSQITVPSTDPTTTQPSTQILKCGLIMPIAPLLDYTADHWVEVKGIISQAVNQIKDLKFKTDIVSNSDGEIDVIHKRIVQNLYNADIVVCDISGKNPNVMFELGMRLTFDKPTIIIKDDATDFIFDTGLIEHLTYPKDLRFNKIVKFQTDLAKAIAQTYKKSIEDSKFSTFLGNFGEFKVPALHQTQVSDVQHLILDEISSVRKEINLIKRNSQEKQENISSQITLNNLKSVIAQFIKANNAYGAHTEKLVGSSEFTNFLKQNNINPYDFAFSDMVNLVEDIQNDLLPF